MIVQKDRFQLKGANEMVNLQNILKQAFNTAAEKTMASLSLVDAEPEMIIFLEMVLKHPEEKQFVMDLFIDALTNNTRLHPWEFVQYCLHDLKWAEMGVWFDDMKARSKNIDEEAFWIGMKKSLSEDWKYAKYYGRYTKDQKDQEK